VYGMIHDAGVPGELLEYHGHNDLHKVVINPEAAWLYGCAACNGALLGTGERTGNTPVEAMVVEASQLRGAHIPGVNYAVITEIARYFEDEIGYQIPANQPFVGRDFNTTRAGIHADGLTKDEEIYNVFDTSKVLDRPPHVAVTDKSGLAGIVHWINGTLHLPAGRRVDKHTPGVVKIYEGVMVEYDAGRTTSVSDEEMLGWVKTCMPELLENS
jgi:citrate (Re)-synthase